MRGSYFIHLLVFALFTASASCAFAQSNTPEIMGAASGSVQIDAVYLDWTVGESVIITMEQPSFFLTTGFHQNDRYCAGDFNGDGVINTSDLTLFLAQIGCAGVCPGDLNFDGLVNQSDLSIFLTLLGTICEY